MKKLLLSAIACVAFAGSSFASNEVVQFTDTTCDLIWDMSYRDHRADGKSVKDSQKEADNAKKNCEDGSGVNGPVTGPNAPVLAPRLTF